MQFVEAEIQFTRLLVSIEWEHSWAACEILPPSKHLMFAEALQSSKQTQHRLGRSEGLAYWLTVHHEHIISSK